ncbi:hypothetical protein LOZ53_006821 [Ophidiomyces ophidiicola]|nr:hypothetical protein LOZ54_006664 [Ophidiomyces ophidiicola]KAI1978818.1 hypothetical protein LOZ53_006821 [Ophidiomyces ophidiicola]KAI1979636.1 hypothetical protein LOZ55_001781 [Ophidiomyces ophidiicola]KAI1999534.1 hypothetical protein LOZ51_002025 [Ophidiomyces ophidiicola]KAI2078393.1 hypothetical protein LOZ36_006843 [Ophidiomyces ophidiicola]
MRRRRQQTNLHIRVPRAVRAHGAAHGPRGGDWRRGAQRAGVGGGVRHGVGGRDLRGDADRFGGRVRRVRHGAARVLDAGQHRGDDLRHHAELPDPAAGAGARAARAVRAGVRRHHRPRRRARGVQLRGRAGELRRRDRVLVGGVLRHRGRRARGVPAQALRVLRPRDLERRGGAAERVVGAGGRGAGVGAGGAVHVAELVRGAGRAHDGRYRVRGRDGCECAAVRGVTGHRGQGQGGAVI